MALSKSQTVHAIYLAIIAVLLVVIVYASAQAIRAHKMVKQVEKHFGITDEILAKRVAQRSEPLRVATTCNLTSERTYDEYRKEVDQLVDRAQLLEDFGPKNKLSNACAHALVGGKRLRAIIVLEIVRKLNHIRQQENTDKIPMLVDGAEAALFIEYLHTASLVIDDTPAFDGDTERRGRPAVHVITSPAVAQMAAISLMAGAFQNACRQIDWIHDNCPDFYNADRVGMAIAAEISRAIGVFGAAGGQYMDTTSIDELRRDFGENALMDIMERKTATFFEIAFIAGWLVGCGDTNSVADIKEAGRCFGIAFQIADDLGDREQDRVRRKAGKPGWNFANATTETLARQEVERNLEACSFLLRRLGLWGDIWKEIYSKVREMAKESESSDAA